MIIETEILGLDVSSALSHREQISAMFHNTEMFQEVVGEGGSVFVFPRLIADIQKKGKPAFPNTHSVVCECMTAWRKCMFAKAVLIFSYVADSVHLWMQLLLHAWRYSLK